MEQRQKQVRAWGTAEEIGYIRGIGTHSEAIKQPRKEMLRNYRAACERRRCWDGIDREAVLEFTDKQLAAAR